MDIINERLMQFYRDNHTAHRLPSLRLTNIIDKATEFPQLRGKVVKAASTRAIVPFLSHFAGQLDCTTTFGKHRLKMVRWLERIYEVMYESPMFLTSAQAPPHILLESQIGKSQSQSQL